MGNRLTVQGQTTASVFNDGNRLIEDQNFIYRYDDNGNLIQKTDKTTNEEVLYSYDVENRLVEVNNNGIATSYKYDGLGRRIEKNENGTIQKYIYDNFEPDANIVLQFDGSNNLTAKYTYGVNVDSPLMIDQNGQSYFYNSDALKN